MLSVISCTVSVFRRLSANMKAPVSTVSRSRVAECCCSLVGSSLHATWALGCNRLFTVSTIAWVSSDNTAVSKRKRSRCRAVVVHWHAKSNKDSIDYMEHWDCRTFFSSIDHVDKSWQQKMMQWKSSIPMHADIIKAKTQKALSTGVSTLKNFKPHLSLPPHPHTQTFLMAKRRCNRKSTADVLKIKLN